MTFKDAMEHYRAGTASEEERQLVEQELEKSQLIAEYLDAQWEEKPILPAAAPEEMKQVRKSLRRRNALTVLTSLLLAAALLLGTVYIGIPAAESFYWDPSVTSYGTPYSTDLELTLSAYTELFCPDINIASATEKRTGFAAYEISIQYWDAYRGGDSKYAMGTIEKGELTLPSGFLRQCPVNIFDRATYPFFESSAADLQSVYDNISQLPEYVRVVAAVSFPEDKSMEQVLEFQDSLLDGQIGWTAIRSGPLDEQRLPLCGMDIYQSGSVRTEVNAYYPYLDTKGAEINAANLETHFKSLLQYSLDQANAGTGIPVWSNVDQFYYAKVLEYVKEYGVYSYGCYISGTPETFLALIESGAVTKVHVEDVWIDAWA